jgi:hypothetical protein
MKLELMPLSHLGAECGRFLSRPPKGRHGEWTKFRCACQSREIRTSRTQRISRQRLIT